MFLFFFFKQKTAYEMRISDWSSDVCSSDLLPCAILELGDDADAIEASLIENMARLDPDEVTQWASFVRLVKEGRKVEDIAATYGLPDLAVKRVLAPGNLLPRRSEERRVGQEGVRRCRSRWSPHHTKKNTTT